MTKARNIADLLDATGDVVSSALDNVPPSDNASSLTTGTLPVARLADGSITNAKLGNDAKVVKSASAPSTPVEGDLWYDTNLEVLKIYSNTSSAFIKVSAEIAVLSSVTGNIFTGQTSNLTLSGSGFLSSNLVVNFLQASDAIDVDVTVAPTSDTSATVTVPSSVYNNVTSGNVVTIKVTNSDFKSSGNQTITAETPPYSVDYLVIAGGGSGGGSNSNSAGGGGAGGYRNSYNNETSGGNSSSESSLTFNANTVYTITVGAGGSAVSSAVGNDGSNSSISGSDITTITSIGGGGGASQDSGGNGRNGGSGGGASYDTNSDAKTGGSGTSGQGFDGGDKAFSSSSMGAGGGGAGQLGESVDTSNSPSSEEGAGGNGLASSITGSSVTRAGGGGGSDENGINGGTGGSGGGGNGGGGNATANTGGGGGGINNTTNNSGSGGSGVVILRMPTSSYSGTTTGSPTVSQSGSDTILTFNSSGSYTG